MTIDSPASPVRKREECPTCGAKLPDVPVSLCPYCASPLETQADRDAIASVHAARIGRIAEHKDFEEAMAWTPPEGPRWLAGRRRSWWGVRGVIVGVLVVLGSVAAAGFTFDPAQPLLWIGLLVAGLGVWWLRQGRGLVADSVRAPLMRRPALILDRRSETRIRGWNGDTTYYFRIEFEDGGQGEFAYPGQGPQDDPYANNLPGVAYTRGQELLHFRHIRV